MCTLAVFAVGCGSLEVGPRHATSNLPPVVALYVQAIAPSAAPLQLDASASYDPDGEPLSFVFAFGDGTSVQTSSSTVEHAFANSGLYEVAVHVRDLRGGEAVAAHDISVRDQFPEVPDFCTEAADCSIGNACTGGICYWGSEPNN